MYWASGGTVPRILNLGTRWRWVVRFTPLPFYPQGKTSRYPLDRRVGWSHSRSGRGSEEKNPLPAGYWTTVIQPVAYWLNYHGSR